MPVQGGSERGRARARNINAGGKRGDQGRPKTMEWGGWPPSAPPANNRPAARLGPAPRAVHVRSSFAPRLLPR